MLFFTHNQTQYTQPALFALEWSLGELWRSRGVVPSLVMGHSVGEIVAACVAGVMSMETGMELTVQRSRLMQVGVGGHVCVSNRYPHHHTILP